MPQLSERVISITGTDGDGWEIFNLAREMKINGAEIIELTIGEHDDTTHSLILDAMHKSAREGNTGYASVTGTKSLRQEVANRVQTRTGIHTEANNVIITPGGQAGLFAAHVALGNQGDTGLIIDPFYATYPTTLRSAGLNPRMVKTSPEDNFIPSANELTKNAKNAKTLLINSPNNPTGTVYDKSNLFEISKVAIENDLWVISDEVYDTQVWVGEHISIRSVANMENRTAVIGSMSKSHAMTGSRLGWVVAPEQVIEKLSDLACNTNYGVPGFIQDAGLYALTQMPNIEKTVAEPFSRRRGIAQKIIKEYPDIKMHPSLGGMYLMLDIRATGLNGIEFSKALLEATNIAVMPGESFGKSSAGHIRVAMTISDDKFEYATHSICSFASNFTTSTN